VLRLLALNPPRLLMCLYCTGWQYTCKQGRAHEQRVGASKHACIRCAHLMSVCTWERKGRYADSKSTTRSCQELCSPLLWQEG
jgi:hypothetical protein